MTKATTRQDPEPIDSPEAEERALLADDAEPQPRPYDGDDVVQEGGL